jgi:hypothetical protein
MAKSKKRPSKKRPAKKRPSKKRLSTTKSKGWVAVAAAEAAEVARLRKAVRISDVTIKDLRGTVADFERDIEENWRTRVTEAEGACRTKVTELEGALAKAYADIAELTAKLRAGEGQPPVG